MICFDVFVNGRKKCTAGVGEFGVLDAKIIWYNRMRTDGDAVDESHNGEFIVGGFEDSDPWRGEHVTWLAELVELKAGDELLVKVVESDSADPPVKRGIDLGPDMEKRVKEFRRQQYEKLKREFDVD